MIHGKPQYHISKHCLSKTFTFITDCQLRSELSTKVTEKTKYDYNERFIEDINVNPNPTDHITHSTQDFEYEGGLPFGFSAATWFSTEAFR